MNIFLFLFLFLWLSGQRGVFAKECCSYDPKKPLDETHCVAESGGATPIECDPATEKCNVFDNTCIAIAATSTRSPTCPTGSKGIEDLPGCSALEKQFPDYKKRFCCKESWFGLSCALKNGTWWGSGLGGLATCNDVMLVLRDSCPGQNWRLNSTTWTCEQFAATPWESKLVPCGSAQGINTAIGCVPTSDLKGLLGFILKFALLASGGVILLMTIATGFTIITSGGNPEKLQAAKENIVALFSGLLLIAFSLVLLQTIGANVLGLPTF